jgi:hypothetical protein
MNLFVCVVCVSGTRACFFFWHSLTVKSTNKPVAYLSLCQSFVSQKRDKRNSSKKGRDVGVKEFLYRSSNMGRMKAQLVISHRPCVKPAYSSRNACINRLLTEKYSYLLKTSICVCVSVCIRKVHTGRNKIFKAFQRGETVRRGSGIQRL